MNIPVYANLYFLIQGPPQRRGDGGQREEGGQEAKCSGPEEVTQRPHSSLRPGKLTAFLAMGLTSLICPMGAGRGKVARERLATQRRARGLPGRVGMMRL